jgi:hypothetical protein
MKKIYLALLGCCVSLLSLAQTVVMTPNNSGGFENGPTFTANLWTVVNDAFNPWAVGNGSVNFGTRGAYIGTATTFTGTNNASISHFYRNTFNIPAGSTNALLTFRYRQPVIDPGNDSLVVSIGVATNPVPVAGTTVSAAYTRLYANTATAYPGYVEIGPIDLTSFANNNLRLVFTHVNNGSGPIGIPAIDSVSLNYCPPITGTFVFCAGNNVTLNTTNNVLGGTWSSSNTAIASFGGTSVTAASVNGVSAGTAVITHTGGTCTVTATVTVNPVPTVITGATQICQGNSTVLSSTPAGGAWSSSNTAVAAISSGTVTAVSPGTANITYMFMPSCRATTTVTVNGLPFLQTVTGGGSFCASGSGLPVGLTGSETGVSYDLYNGATLVTTVAGTGSPINFGTFTAPGTYTVLATNTTTLCTRNMAGSAVIAVTTPVVPTVSISSTAPPTLCSGTLVTYTATPVNGGVTPTYEWYINGVLAGSTNIYTYVPSNGDVVSVTLRPGGICVNPDSTVSSQTIVVNPLATPGVTISVSPGNPSCLGSPVTFSATPISGGTSPSFRWTKNGVNVATGPTYTYVPNMGDVVYCMITSNYVCRSVDTAFSSNITMMTQASASLPVVSIAVDPGTTVPTGAMVNFSASKTGGTTLVTYQWHVNGSQISGATNATWSTNSLLNGDIVTCKVTNTDPCANFTLKSVVISTTTTGIAQYGTVNGVAIVPNPNTGVFTLVGNVDSKTAFIRVTNLVGQVVYQQRINTDNGELNAVVTLPNLANGMYLLNVETENGNKTLHFTITN